MPIYGVIHALEHAWREGYQRFWLESDSSLVHHGFLDQLVVPWSFRGRWSPCLHFCKHMQFKVSHVFHEENHCIDKLVNLVLIYRKQY